MRTLGWHRAGRVLSVTGGLPSGVIQSMAAADGRDSSSTQVLAGAPLAAYDALDASESQKGWFDSSVGERSYLRRPGVRASEPRRWLVREQDHHCCLPLSVERGAPR